MEVWPIYKRDVITAVNVALIVGTILAVINHYDILLSRKLVPTRIMQLIVTYVVPFVVSLFTSALKNNLHKVTG